MSDLPRLLLCSFDVIPGPSGSSRRLTEYLKALPDRFNVVVLSAKTPDHSHIEKYQGARLLRVPVGSGDLASRIQSFERAVRRQLESEEYALAHFTDPFGGYALCELKGEYGYRLIYEAQTFPSQELRYTHPQTEGDKRFLAKVRRQELFCLMNADLVVTGSEATQTYIQSLGASTEQIRVIRAPVDLGPYTPDVLGVPDNTPMRLMYLGSQAGWQGLPTLLRALAIAIEQQAEVRLTLVGARHPDWQPHLEDLAKELGVQKHVEFQPPVLHDDIAKVLALSDVGVLPLDDVDRNRLQGGPLAKVSEYFAAGRPVIAADLPVTRELIPDSVALFHAPGSARALADRIIELAADAPRRVEMGLQARAFAEQELDAGLIRGQLLDIYDEMLGRQTVVGTPAELPMPTMTGTPTNRLSQLAPPEGKRSSRSKSSAASEAGKAAPTPAPTPRRKSPRREDLPLVVGQVLEEGGLDTRLIKTEPDVRSNEPPVVMGLPIHEKKKEDKRREASSVPSEPREEPPAPTPIIRTPVPIHRDEPVPAATRAPVQPPAEEPSPTPIVQMKTITKGRTRSEPSSSRSSASTPAPTAGVRTALPPEPSPPKESTDRPRLPSPPPSTFTTGTRPVLTQEPPSAQETTDKTRPPAPLTPPPLTPPPTSARAALPPEPAPAKEPADKARPPTLPPLPTTAARAASPPEPAAAQEAADKPRAPLMPPALPSRGTSLSGTWTTVPRSEPAEPPVLPTAASARAVPKEEPEELPEAEPDEIAEAEPDELAEAEAQEIPEAEAELDAATPPEPRPRLEELEEISSEEIHEAGDAVAADEAEPVEATAEEVEDADDAIEAAAEEDPPEVIGVLQEEAPVLGSPLPEPLSSALDPWFAQLAHGYCPPEGAQFARHTPPTTFPGRDDETTDPSRMPSPTQPPQGVVRGKPS